MLSRADVHYVIKYRQQARADAVRQAVRRARWTCRDWIDYLGDGFYVLNGEAGTGTEVQPFEVLRLTTTAPINLDVPVRVYVLITSVPIHAHDVDGRIMPAIGLLQLFLIEHQVESTGRVLINVAVQNGASTIPCSTRNHCTPRDT